jgi:hypothetical protein
VLKASVLSAAFAMAAICASIPQQASARARASGSYHTTSHGGHYSSGRGSSHRGGHYRSASTGNQYRRHKP